MPRREEMFVLLLEGKERLISKGTVRKILLRIRNTVVDSKEVPLKSRLTYQICDDAAQVR